MFPALRGKLTLLHVEDVQTLVNHIDQGGKGDAVIARARWAGRISAALKPAALASIPMMQALISLRPEDGTMFFDFKANKAVS